MTIDRTMIVSAIIAVTTIKGMAGDPAEIMRKRRNVSVSGVRR
jgi:hypothetical protein